MIVTTFIMASVISFNLSAFLRKSIKSQRVTCVHENFEDEGQVFLENKLDSLLL